MKSLSTLVRQFFCNHDWEVVSKKETPWSPRATLLPRTFHVYESHCRKCGKTKIEYLP